MFNLKIWPGHQGMVATRYNRSSKCKILESIGKKVLESTDVMSPLPGSFTESSDMKTTKGLGFGEGLSGDFPGWELHSYLPPRGGVWLCSLPKASLVRGASLEPLREYGRCSWAAGTVAHSVPERVRAADDNRAELPLGSNCTCPVSS